MFKRALVVLASIGVLLIAYVGEEAVRTIQLLDRVEMERDTWQRPAAVLQELDLHPADVVVDLGAGAGYFTLKIATAVGASGRVLAVDLRRESLAFLWIRARRRGLPAVTPIVGGEADPQLPSHAAVDAVLIANTFHELSDPDPILGTLAAHMRSHARMVVVDRQARTSAPNDAHREHSISPDVARRSIERRGFLLLRRNDIFIDQPTDDDTWWMLVFEKP